MNNLTNKVEQLRTIGKEIQHQKAEIELLEQECTSKMHAFESLCEELFGEKGARLVENLNALKDVFVDDFNDEYVDDDFDDAYDDDFDYEYDEDDDSDCVVEDDYRLVLEIPMESVVLMYIDENGGVIRLKDDAQ